MTSSKSTEILEAARDLFSGKGYAATSMRDVADAVGLQPGSLYAHIRSKDELLVEIIDEMSQRFFDAGKAALEDGSRTVVERLNDFIRCHLRIVIEHRTSATVFFHEWRSLEGESRRLALRQRREYESMLVGLIQEGVDRGELRPVDPHLTAIALLGLLNWTYTWYAPEGALSADGLADMYTHMLIDGIGQPAVPSLSGDGDGWKKTTRRQLRS